MKKGEYFIIVDENGELVKTVLYSDDEKLSFKNFGVNKDGNILAFGDVKYDDGAEALNISTLSLDGKILSSDEYLRVPKIQGYGGYDCACGGVSTSENGYVLTGFTVYEEFGNVFQYDSSFDGRVYGLVISDTWATKYNISTKTDNNGKINVLDSSSAGETITFEIIPNKGYKINNLIIKDSNGNDVLFNDNKFIMPSSDVIIEANFKSVLSSSVENPDTIDLIIYAIIILALLLIGIILLKKKIHKLD